MLYALPNLSWQGVLWLGEGCWKACLALLIGSWSAEGLSISSESHFCAAKSQSCHWGWCIWVSFAGDRRVRGSVLCLLQRSRYCLPWLSGVPLDQQEHSSCMELGAKRRSLYSWAVRDGWKHSMRLGHLQVQHQSKALSLWQPETLGNAEVRKALAQLVELC